MNEFLAILATFIFGLGVTSTLGYALDQRQRAAVLSMRTSTSALTSSP